MPLHTSEGRQLGDMDLSDIIASNFAQQEEVALKGTLTLIYSGFSL